VYCIYEDWPGLCTVSRTGLVCVDLEMALFVYTASMTGLLSVLFLGLAWFVCCIHKWLGLGNAHIRKTGLVWVLYLGLDWCVYWI
jgi:hypothetical protein